VKIITLASTKGGVGKSTTGAVLIDSLLRRGDTVRLVDLDSQRSIIKWAEPVSARNEGLTISHFPDEPGSVLQDHYNMMLSTVQEETDWVVFDTKGADDPRILAAMALSDLVIAPAAPVSEEVVGIAKTLIHIKNALEGIGEPDTDPRDMFLVLYQKPGQFLDAEATDNADLINDYYGAVVGMYRSLAVAGIIGRKMTTNEMLAEVDNSEADNRTKTRARATITKIQQEADALLERIMGKLS